MPDHVYRIIEVAGSSEKSIEDAIQNAVGRASRTLRQVGWFEVVETRGHVEDGKGGHYQVPLNGGFTLDRRARRPRLQLAETPAFVHVKGAPGMRKSLAELVDANDRRSGVASVAS